MDDLKHLKKGFRFSEQKLGHQYKICWCRLLAVEYHLIVDTCDKKCQRERKDSCPCIIDPG